MAISGFGSKQAAEADNVHGLYKKPASIIPGNGWLHFSRRSRPLFRECPLAQVLLNQCKSETLP
jgi:hypothetical protein